MSDKIEIKVPDIGGAVDVDVIEILVQPGDEVVVDDALLTLEGDKASMEVPSDAAGVVDEIKIKIGDKVSAGDVILTLSATAAQPAPSSVQSDVSEVAVDRSEKNVTSLTEIVVPDMGDAHDVDVIEVHIKAGDCIQQDDPMVTLEGDKATMEVPAVSAGTVASVSVKVGDKVSAHSVLGQLSVQGAVKTAEVVETKPAPVLATTAPAPVTPALSKSSEAAAIYASPAVRRIARELDVELGNIQGTGDKGRITKDDVKRALSGSSSTAGGLSVIATPVVDFSQFGAVETVALSKIKKISGANLHRNWVSIPHVTQFDQADVTKLEAFRQEQKALAAEQGIKLTPIVFIMKAVVASLKAFPQFNASLDAQADNLILKSYFHVGVAVDTPKGLVVPVIRDVDRKSLFELARELGEVSKKAREKGLSLKEMQGGCFTISSLGGIGGTAFTPIINAPEVAILGVSKSQKQPVYNDLGEIEPRLMMPLSLSYDHRVIDGAEAARFVVHLASRLADIRTLLL